MKLGSFVSIAFLYLPNHSLAHFCGVNCRHTLPSDSEFRAGHWEDLDALYLLSESSDRWGSRLELKYNFKQTQGAVGAHRREVGRVPAFQKEQWPVYKSTWCNDSQNDLVPKAHTASWHPRPLRGAGSGACWVTLYRLRHTHLRGRLLDFEFWLYCLLPLWPWRP